LQLVENTLYPAKFVILRRSLGMFWLRRWWRNFMTHAESAFSLVNKICINLVANDETYALAA